MRNFQLPLAAASIVREIREHWGAFVGLGLLMVVLGLLAIIAAGATTLVTIVFYGALLLVAGIAQLVRAYSERHHGSRLWIDLLMGTLYAAVGLLLMFQPGAGALSITLLMASFFVVSGIFRSSASIALRYKGWGWTLFSGVLTFVLGLLILKQWPASGTWVIGMFVGLDLFIHGWSISLLALSLHGAGRAHLPDQTLPQS